MNSASCIIDTWYWSKVT